MNILKNKTVEVPLNRVEGDLEIRVEMDDGRVTDAWSAGIMFRGIENMLSGRGPLDSLVITPRICGICGTAHLTAACSALESITGITPPPNAVLVRNLALMAEHLQSDIRHAFLMFTADFVNSGYKNSPLYAEAVRRYEPFKGEAVIDVVKQTKKILEIVAILGGQWPHSSYMVPGGIATTPSRSDILQCSYLLENYTAWYEQKILGCPIERWMELKTGEDLDEWLEERAAHHDSELGFYIRYARQIGLDRIGGSHDNFISYGQQPLPPGSKVQGKDGGSEFLMPGGFARGTEIRPFHQEKITEHVAYSWFNDYEGGRHPYESETVPYATGYESKKYSWLKAPRYDGLPAETGPLADMVVSKNPLFDDLINRSGSSAFLRELARLIRSTELIPAMKEMIHEIDPGKGFYQPSQQILEGSGFGSTGASRGALGHWVQIEAGKISKYQIITPTAWNGSPRDAWGARGPWEEALIGTQVKDPENPVELGHIIRSFDPCLVCAVHAVHGSKSIFRYKL